MTDNDTDGCKLNHMVDFETNESSSQQGKMKKSSNIKVFYQRAHLEDPITTKGGMNATLVSIMDGFAASEN